MSEVTVDLSEVEDLIADLIREDRIEVKRRVNKALDVGIDWLHDRAVQDAPRDTGALVESITKDPRSAGYGRRVYLRGDGNPPRTNGARHGFFQEFGTSRHPPQPFLMIHAPAAGDKAANALADQLKDVLAR